MQKKMLLLVLYTVKRGGMPQTPYVVAEPLET